MLLISITVLNQYACSVSIWVLYYSVDYNNKIYVKTIDNFCVIVHAERR